MRIYALSVRRGSCFRSCADRILLGSVHRRPAWFARSLVETGLIDEYRLLMHPAVLGAGERIFTAPLTIEPMSTTVFSGGAVAHVFAAHP